MSDAAREMTPERMTDVRAVLTSARCSYVGRCNSGRCPVHGVHGVAVADLLAHVDALTERAEAAERERDALKRAERQAGTVLAEAGDCYDPHCPFCGVDCGADEEAEPVHSEDCPMAPQHEDVGDWMRAIVDLHGQQQFIADIAREALNLPRDASPKDVSDALDRLSERAQAEARADAAEAKLGSLVEAWDAMCALDRVVEITTVNDASTATWRRFDDALRAARGEP